MLKQALVIESEELCKIHENTLNHLMDPDQPGGAWFDSKEECEDWAGDVLFSVMEFVLNSLGIVIIEEN